MNQQTKMKLAKESTYERIKDSLEDFEQIGDFSYASLETINGEEWWTVVTIQAKKNFDIDAAVEQFNYSKNHQ